MVILKNRQERDRKATHAGVAELADARDLKSRGRNPVPVRPRSPAPYRGIEQLVARRAHNPEVGGSSPPPATRNPLESPDSSGLFLLSATFSRGLFWVLKSDPDFDPYGNFSGLDRAINCRRGRVPWPPPPAAGPRWSRGRRCPG